MDAIEWLRSQHDDARALLERCDEASGIEQLRLLEELADVLALHTALEERIFYPACAAVGLEHLVEDALDEHASVKRQLVRIVDLEEDGAELASMLDQLREDVLHHLEDEERLLFPKAAERLGGELDRLGVQLVELCAELEDLEPGDRLSDPQEARL